MIEHCEICGNSSWDIIYRGSVRAGPPGVTHDNGVISRCNQCKVDRLDEASNLDPLEYETQGYREKMGQGVTVENFFAHADQSQLLNLRAIWPIPVRGKIVADIGCGGGAFLDQISGQAHTIVAIEPTVAYHSSLLSRGYKVYPYVSEAQSEWSETVDLAVSFHVIEHVRRPVDFLKEINLLLRPEGYLLIATPNRNEILMKLIPDEFLKFFYRRAHRHYFDEESLRYCIREAGLRVVDAFTLQSFGMSNALGWLRDRKPIGHKRLAGIDRIADEHWKVWLESSGQGDNLYILCSR